jgi:hypothetical protein
VLALLVAAGCTQAPPENAVANPALGSAGGPRTATGAPNLLARFAAQLYRSRQESVSEMIQSGSMMAVVEGTNYVSKAQHAEGVRVLRSNRGAILKSAAALEAAAKTTATRPLPQGLNTQEVKEAEALRALTAAYFHSQSAQLRSLGSVTASSLLPVMNQYIAHGKRFQEIKEKLDQATKALGGDKPLL